MSITTKEREDIFNKFGKNTKDSGSVYSQVALFTAKITFLTEHLTKHKKDYGTQRSLQIMVGKRRKLLDYLKNKDISEYQQLISKLGLRK